ncbi:unnamed protein product, partial [Prunus brigantina]
WLERRLWVTGFLERRVPRKAGFTEQRLPPALGSGRITGQWKPLGHSFIPSYFPSYLDEMLGIEV